MAQFPALPLWTDAYLGDTTHLTTLEHGTYLLLLMAAWRSKDCSLPNDDKMLARYARLTPAQWKRIKPVIIAFFDLENGALVQQRLRDEINLVKQKSNQASKNARARWLKTNKTPHADACFPHSERNATTPTPIPININGHFDDWWKLYPKKTGKQAAEGKYIKIVQKNQATFDQLLDGVKRYNKHLEDNKTERQYTKNPLTWLNQGCWEDEYQAGRKRL